MRKQIQYFGRGSLKKLKGILTCERVDNLFIVSGKNSFTKSGAKDSLEDLLQEYKHYVFSDFKPNPNYLDIEKGLKKLEENKSKIVVAIGGGSALDVAKSIVLLKANKSLNSKILSNKNILQPNIPVIAIPTTSGSGSESTHFSVVYYEGKKYSLAHQELLPKYVILDPCLTENLSHYITAYTAFDALSQAIESYWSVNANEESRSYALDTMKLLFSIFPLKSHSVSSKDRELLMIGANLAGKAINISKTTAPHAFSYYLTSQYNIPHGHAVALLLGVFLDLNPEKEGIISSLSENEYSTRLEEIYEIMRVSSGSEAKRKWFALMKASGLETNINKLLTVDSSLTSNLIENVNIQRLSNFPISLDPTKTKSAIERSWNLTLSQEHSSV